MNAQACSYHLLMGGPGNRLVDHEICDFIKTFYFLFLITIRLRWYVYGLIITMHSLPIKSPCIGACELVVLWPW